MILAFGVATQWVVFCGSSLLQWGQIFPADMGIKKFFFIIWQGSFCTKNPVFYERRHKIDHSVSQSKLLNPQYCDWNCDIKILLVFHPNISCLLPEYHVGIASSEVKNIWSPCFAYNSWYFCWALTLKLNFCTSIYHKLTDQSATDECNPL